MSVDSERKRIEILLPTGMWERRFVVAEYQPSYGDGAIFASDNGSAPTGRLYIPAGQWRALPTWDELRAERDKLRAELDKLTGETLGDLAHRLGVATAERDEARGLLTRCLSAVRDGSNAVWMDGDVRSGQAYAALADEIRAFLARTEPKAPQPAEPAAPHDYGPSKCEVCGWPLAASAEKGCVPGNCSFRPGDPEWQRRLTERRAELAAWKARTEPKGKP